MTQKVEHFYEYKIRINDNIRNYPQHDQIMALLWIIIRLLFDLVVGDKWNDG